MIIGKKALVYLNRNNIEIHIPNRDPLVINLSEKAIDNLEVKNAKYIEKEITKGLIAEEIKKRNAIIVLSEDHLFSKTTTAKTKESREKIISDFLDEIPFKPETVVYKIFMTTKGSTVVAAHNGIFMEILRTLKKLGWKVNYVIPYSTVGKINSENVTEIFKNKKNLQTSNFYTFEHKEIPSGFKVGLGILSTLVIGLSAYLFIRNAGEKQIDNKPAETIEPVAQEVVVEFAEPVEEVVVVEKNEISVQVLNGSGIPGQAGRTQEILLEAGYEDIEVGNADNTNYVEAQLTYSEDVPSKYLEEIGDLLKENYQNVVEKTYGANDTINYDIVIITGELITSN